MCESFSPGSPAPTHDHVAEAVHDSQHHHQARAGEAAADGHIAPHHDAGGGDHYRNGHQETAQAHRTIVA